MAIKSSKQQTGEILAKWFAHYKKYKKYSDVPICLVYGSGIPIVLDDGAIQCLSDYYGISDITASTQRTFTKYPSDYVKSSMTYKKRGRFLDSSDGRWVICKDKDFPAYYLLDKTKHPDGYITTDSGAIRTWKNLKDVKDYIENWAK